MKKSLRQIARKLSTRMQGFNYLVEDMPEGEVTLVLRLDDILNGEFESDAVDDPLRFLLDEVITRRWSEGADPYVGSMDTELADKLAVLFGEIDHSVSYLLKHADLNWDGYPEIALYSTSDPLDSSSEWPVNVVCVYISVFTPVLDANKNIVGYIMVCDSLHGYCPEVRYGANDLTPSFSTDHWRDDVGYYHYNEVTWVSDIFRVPADAMNADGTKPFRYDYYAYNAYYQYGEYAWGATVPYGNALWQCRFLHSPP